VSAARNSRGLRPTALSGQGTGSCSFSTSARGATAGGTRIGDGLIEVDALLHAQTVIAITAAPMS